MAPGARGIRRWRLVARIIAASPGQFVIITCVFAIAAGVGIVAHQATIREFASLAASAEQRYGAIVVSVAADAMPSILAPGTPLLATGDDAWTFRAAGGNGASRDGVAGRARAGVQAASEETSPPVVDEPITSNRWLTASLVGEVRETGRRLGLELVPRIDAATIDPDGRVHPLIAVQSDDPALVGEFVEPEVAPGVYRVALRRTQSAAVEWHAVPAESILGKSDDGTVWVRRSWMVSLLWPSDLEEVGATPIATTLVSPASGLPGSVGRDARSSGVTAAFSAAYDLESSLAGIEPAVTVRSWPDRVGYQRYVGAGGGAGALGPLALLVAGVAAAGSVAVATRNRVRDVVLLRTIGFDIADIRGVYARETAVASVGAAILTWIAVHVASASGASIIVDAAVRQTLAGTALLPPIVAFVTLRRQLREPLARVRREAEL